MSTSSRFLLSGAVVAMPLFLVLWAAQAFTREGFRPTFHPMSLLSLGEGGWVQVLNFIVTGALIAGGGTALARTPGALARWSGILIALMGAGLVIAGVFPTDAGAGFPAGAPEGAPVMTAIGAVHQVGFLLTQLAFVAAGIILAIRFARDHRRGWAAACVAAIIATLVVAAVGTPETLAIRLVAASAIELGLVSAVALSALVPNRVRAAYPEPHGSASRA